MSPAHETQSMREIRLLRGRFPRKGGGLTGMFIVVVGCDKWHHIKCVPMTSSQLAVWSDANLSFCAEIAASQKTSMT